MIVNLESSSEMVSDAVDLLPSEGILRRVNQRWFYEPRVSGSVPDSVAPVLQKRQSRPPQRLTASRLGMLARTQKEKQIHDIEMPVVTDRFSTEGMLENLGRATDKYEAAIAMQPEAARFPSAPQTLSQTSGSSFTSQVPVSSDSQGTHLFLLCLRVLWCRQKRFSLTVSPFV
jgi:hypothetical protein